MLEWYIMRTLFFQNRHVGNAARRLIIKRISSFGQPPDYWRRKVLQESRDLLKKSVIYQIFFQKSGFKLIGTLYLYVTRGNL